MNSSRKIHGLACALDESSVEETVRGYEGLLEPKSAACSAEFLNTSTGPEN